MRGPFVAIDRLSDFNGEVVSPLFLIQGGTVQKPMFRTRERNLDFLRLSAYLLDRVKKECF
jgi:hypothetical protein